MSDGGWDDRRGWIAVGMVIVGVLPALVGAGVGIHDESGARLQLSAAILWGLWLGGLPLTATFVALRRPERRTQLGRLVGLAVMAALAVGVVFWLAVVDHDIVGLALVYVPPLQALTWLAQGVVLRLQARRTASPA